MKLNLRPKGTPRDTPPPPLTKGGVVVGMKKEGDKEKIYFVGDDCHLLCVGATRSGKSRCLVLESICLLGLAGESIFCSDPKAELFHYTSEFLKKLGYPFPSYPRYFLRDFPVEKSRKGTERGKEFHGTTRNFAI